MRRWPLLVCLVSVLWIAANFALAEDKAKSPGKPAPAAKPAAAPVKPAAASAKPAVAPAKPAAKDEDDEDEDDSADGNHKPAAKPATAAAKASVDSKPNASKPAEKKPAEKKATVVSLTLKGDYPEGAGQAGPLAEIRPTLAMVVQRLDEAAEDKAVAAVWLRINGLEMGAGKINELRARWREFARPASRSTPN